MSGAGPSGPNFNNDILVAEVEAGNYVFEAVASAWNSATATLKRLAPDGVKYLDVASLSADGASNVVALPEGDVKIAFSGGTPTAFAAKLGRIKGLPY